MNASWKWLGTLAAIFLSMILGTICFFDPIGSLFGGSRTVEYALWAVLLGGVGLVTVLLAALYKLIAQLVESALRSRAREAGR